MIVTSTHYRSGEWRQQVLQQFCPGSLKTFQEGKFSSVTKSWFFIGKDGRRSAESAGLPNVTDHLRGVPATPGQGPQGKPEHLLGPFIGGVTR